MIYISDKEVKELDLDWQGNIDVINDSVVCLRDHEFAQPVKPYLRYRNLKNRIIAMPAFLGGNFNTSGIKWISSFPDNIKKGVPRAHCVVILNDADTGEPVTILNSGSISAIRTASVSGFVIRKYLQAKKNMDITVGIVGFGPIGQYHLQMCSAVIGDRCSRIVLYDLNKVDTNKIPTSVSNRIEIADSWKKAYEPSDIFITCTVSSERYIDSRPKPGSLHLNVSLRDYKPEVYTWFQNAMIVDDWDEVCRENTDIEQFHLEKGLSKEQVRSIDDLLDQQWMKSIDANQPIMFNPMGMAIFDIAISKHYAQRIGNESRGKLLS